jgi:hypothetical protein
MKKEASFVSVATAVALVTMAVSGGMYVGALASDVETLEKEQEKQEEQIQKDHDDVIKLKSDVEHIKQTADTTQLAVARIEQMIREL